MGRFKKQAYKLSERLEYLIYNPSLPQQWKEFTYHQRIFILNGLFRLLNTDFQDEYGRIIDYLLNLKMILCNGKIKQEISGLKGFEGELAAEDIDKSNNYTSKLSFDILFKILLREDFPIPLLMGIDYENQLCTAYKCTACGSTTRFPREPKKNRQCKKCNSVQLKKTLIPSFNSAVVNSYLPLNYDEFEDSSQHNMMLVNRLKKDTNNFSIPLTVIKTDSVTKEAFQDYVKEYQDNYLESFKKYMQERQAGTIPRVLYTNVHIAHDKEKLIADFTHYIDTLQTLYFNQHPEEKSIISGHLTSKQSEPADLEKYFKIAVYRFGKTKEKQTAIAAELFPGEDKKGDDKVQKAIPKAEALMKLAWPEKTGEIWPANFLKLSGKIRQKPSKRNNRE